MGKAQNELKLFLHMAWSVPNHIKRMTTPMAPTVKKKKKSKKTRKDTYESIKEISSKK